MPQMIRGYQSPLSILSALPEAVKNAAAVPQSGEATHVTPRQVPRNQLLILTPDSRLLTSPLMTSETASS